MNFTNIFTVKLSKSETIERINNLVFAGYPANEIDSGKLKGNRITFYKKGDIPVYEFSVYANEETTDIEFKHNGDEFANVLIDTLVHKLSVSLTGEGKRLEIEKPELESIQYPKGGRPGLESKELEYRLGKAREAEQEKKDHPDKTWKEIANRISWKYPGKSGLKLLEDARNRLKRTERNT